MTKSKKHKVLVLFSGGLDSRLAIKLLQEQKNLDIEAVFFRLPFGGGCCNNFACVFNFSQVSGVKLHVMDATKGKLFQDYLKIIRNPKHGTGKAVNPCKDCKIFMLKQAKKLAKKIGADIIATGEVLGQRPMSQLKHQLTLTEKQAKLEGKLLRPLSAKLLTPTIAEEKGIIDRSKLLDILGRSRRIQIALAKKYKIKYPDSGGGCVLCEKDYAKKLTDIFKHKKQDEKILPEEIRMLSYARMFRNKGIILIGRDQEQNQALELLNKKVKHHQIVPETPGPTAIYENTKDKKLAQDLVNAYSSKNLKLRKKFEKFKV